MLLEIWQNLFPGGGSIGTFLVCISVCGIVRNPHTLWQNYSVKADSLKEHQENTENSIHSLEFTRRQAAAAAG